MTDAETQARIEALEREAQTVPTPLSISALQALTEQQRAVVPHLPMHEVQEERFRVVIGMERKNHLEMRVALGEDAPLPPRTAALASVKGPALVEVLWAARAETLALLALVAAREGERTFTVWALGEQVSVRAYALNLRARLERLATHLLGHDQSER
ncbi:hypothetical protein [Deinococcus maricopensis]|uniref:Uncharacterized protein n=1 Tax=Deinococcus maricopensis (strain DSM 21211 / LMG 22137 / NRRL B-23946 / LB-34) TaxID=709986 RepID=E8U8Q9_DEIML|nr:hypothetical protein [Deinococcus maricopensis]ADV67448.1 hypothetical protein Deima_1800 [Deinococcus maricopensis DSM 21211]